MSAHNRIYRHMLAGTAWAMALRLSMRGIGLVSMVVIARLLTPEDFAIMAMGTLVLGLMERVSYLGVSSLLIRKQGTSDDFFNTGWTLQIIQGLMIGFFLFLVAPLAAAFFQDIRANEVMRLLALAAVLNGFNNIGIVIARKNLQFGFDFRFHLTARLIRLVITLALVIVLRDYWALVFAYIFGAATEMLLSFFAHPYRPRLCLRHALDFLKFARRAIPTTVSVYFSQRLDTFAVGRLGSTSQLGVYSIASELASIVITELATAVNRALLPSYATLASDRAKLAEAYLNSLRALGTLYIGLGVGLSAVSADMVAILLGSKWDDVAPYVEWLALSAAAGGMGWQISGQILIVIGHEATSMWLSWLKLGLVAAAVSVAGLALELKHIPIALTLVAILFVPIAWARTAQLLGIPFSALIGVLARPLIAASAMYFAIRLIDNLPLSSLGSLVLSGFLGFSIFLSVQLGLWWLAGKPPGPEAGLIDFLAARLRRT